MELPSTTLAGEVGIRLLFSPLGSKIFARWACFVGGVAFPVYSSFRAIESNHKLEQEQWLRYWIAYGCFTSVETFSDKLLSWLPGYYHIKLLFIIWLQLPLSGGACYNFTANYVRPVLRKYESFLDGIVNGTRNDINNFFIAHLHELKFMKVLLIKLAQHAFVAGGEIRRTLTTNLRDIYLSSSVRGISMPMIEPSSSTQATHESEDSTSASSNSGEVC